MTLIFPPPCRVVGLAEFGQVTWTLTLKVSPLLCVWHYACLSMLYKYIYITFSKNFPHSTLRKTASLFNFPLFLPNTPGNFSKDGAPKLSETLSAAPQDGL